MPWLILHRCSISQSEPSEYAIIRSVHDGEKVTRVVCPNSDCREEFLILGHELFDEAVSNEQLAGLTGLPPGFVIARSRKAAS